MTAIPKELILKQMELGPLNNFLYFIGDAQTKEIAVVDPAWDVGYLCSQAKKSGFKITNLFLTHGHPDHVNGLDEILRTHDVPAYISKHEAPFLKPNHPKIGDRLTNIAESVIRQMKWEVIKQKKNPTIKADSTNKS